MCTLFCCGFSSFLGVGVLFLVVFFLVSAILLLVRISGVLVIFAGFFSSFLCGLCSTNIQCSLGGWRKEDAATVATFSWFVYADCCPSSFFVPICEKWDQCCSVGGCDMGPSIKLFVWSFPIFFWFVFLQSGHVFISSGLTVVPLICDTIMTSSFCTGSVVTISRLWKHLKLLIVCNVNGSLGRTNAAGTIWFCGLY